ncbi:MAG: hypothetical protein H0T46_19155 [Deltaproteobacteria bacterium]|nr:hypothetical protein [Deltaproteobacteria bacterium]
MVYGWIISLILGGILAISGLIVAKKPDAKELIGKLQPFQAIIGIALLVFGVLNLMDAIRLLGVVSLAPVLVLSTVGGVFASILLGILFGMPMIAKLSASGAAKGEELGRKLAPIQTIVGIVALVCGLVMLLMILGILKPM